MVEEEVLTDDDYKPVKSIMTTKPANNSSIKNASKTGTAADTAPAPKKPKKGALAAGQKSMTSFFSKK